VPSLDSKADLHRLYKREGKTVSEMAEIFDCSTYTVRDRMDTHGIERERHDPAKAREHISPQSSKLKNGYALWFVYHGLGKSTRKIAEDWGCDKDTVNRWLDKHDINKRTRGGQPGELNHNWRGGFRDYGEGWTKQKRESVRERDNYECQSCGLEQSDHNGALHVHHIQRARDFDDPEKRNSMENLIALCATCHKVWEQMSPLRPQ